MVEYLEDIIEENPAAEFPTSVQESGQYVHKTGDPVTDRWQEQLARGERIDFREAFGDAESLRQFDAIMAESKERARKRRGG